jgi:hypothetical protein
MSSGFFIRKESISMLVRLCSMNKTSPDEGLSFSEIAEGLGEDDNMPTNALLATELSKTRKQLNQALDLLLAVQLQEGANHKKIRDYFATLRK